MLVQHGTAPDYNDSPRSKTSKYTIKNTNVINNNNNQKNINGGQAVMMMKQQQQQQHHHIEQSTINSKSSCSSSDTEPFYLHPPSVRNSCTNLNSKRNSVSSPEMYGSVLPNDGLYINPMRNGLATPPSPGGSISGESFYLHDPQEVIYNRVKDLFDSDGSQKDGSNNGSAGNGGGGGGGHPITVQAEVHSSSSGAGSGSEESLSDGLPPGKQLNNRNANNVPNIHHHINGTVNNNNNSTIPSSNGQHTHEHHDYEDIYLVREEARGVSKGKFTGRSRSRDSGSHSRSASANSNRSTDVIVQFTSNVRYN